MTKIAVLIPTYKPQSYFERCLLSLEMQTLNKDDFRVYIALNGPKDKYESYIKSLLNKFNFNYKYIYLDKAGVSNARNKLIDISYEPFLSFVDDDDLLSENFLKNTLAKADENFIVCSNTYNFENDLKDLKPNFMGEAFKKMSDEELSKYKSRKFFSAASAKLIHRNLVATTRFDTRLDMGEDSLFMAELSLRVKGIRKTDKSTCYYVYERPNSASRDKVNKWKEFKRINYLLYKYIFMFFGKYDKVFILTRMVATILYVRRLM